MAEQKKLGVIGRHIFKAKLRTPKGVKLTSDETVALIDIWKEDVKTIQSNSELLTKADTQIVSIVETQLPDVLKEVEQARSEALRFFKITKDPLKKPEWARRLVVADRSLQSIRNSKKRMLGMSSRVKALVADASLEKKALDIRIAEAEAYVSMGKGLQLVGDTLISARERASTASIEFSNLELGIENIEAEVAQSKQSSVVAEAERIAGI